MRRNADQARLSNEQVAAFYHDCFVDRQVRDFQEMVGDTGSKLVLDVGGGCGFFAKALNQATGCPTRVIDLDENSIHMCERIGVDGRIGDALAPVPEGDEEIVCFNLILHHLVSKTERETRDLQVKALSAWRHQATIVFVNEYIYESFFGHLSGRLIYEITSSKPLSALGKAIGRFIPALRANTFGVGVRFRSHQEWRQLFKDAGYNVLSAQEGMPERVAPALRALLIKTIRRDSFLLAPH